MLQKCNIFVELFNFVILSFFFRVYSVHDEIKDKHFELELGWIGKGEFNYIY